MDPEAVTSAVVAEPAATAVARPRFTARCRVVLGAGLITHGLAHALPGMRAADRAGGSSLLLLTGLRDWHHLAAGDTVFATQPGYLGVRVRPGWRS